MIATVTITGADDRVDPIALAALGNEFPFVEWGLLVSASRRGSPRYPSGRWLTDTQRVSAMRLAAHFCGKAARETIRGDDRWLSLVPLCARVQLNGYDAPVHAPFLRLAESWPVEFILQVRDEATCQLAADDSMSIDGAGYATSSLLFDPSGGRGTNRIITMRSAASGVRSSASRSEAFPSTPFGPASSKAPCSGPIARGSSSRFISSATGSPARRSRAKARGSGGSC